MDTRSKIVPHPEMREMLGDRPSCWVSGHFDPLLAEHVGRLRKLARPGQLLVVEVLDSVRPLLPQRARAELVAALSMVDYVVLGTSGGHGQTACDSGLTERFIERVMRRHQAERAP